MKKKSRSIVNGQTIRWRTNWAYPLVCCDCGLTHRYDVHIRKGGIVELTIWRDDWLTQKERKEYSKERADWLRRHFKRK